MNLNYNGAMVEVFFLLNSEHLSSSFQRRGRCARRALQVPFRNVL